MTKRVLLATPTKGGVPPYWVRLFESVLRQPIPGFDVEFVIEDAHQAINLSRNAIAHGAMLGKYDINVQLDADHPIDRSHLVRLLSRQEPVVSGLYAKKAKGDAYWLGLRTKGVETRKDGLCEADYLPTGFLKVDVAVYHAIAAKFPERKYVYSTDDGKDYEAYDLFPIGLVGPNTAEAKLAHISKASDVWANEAGGIADEEFSCEVAATLKRILPTPARLLGEDYFFSRLARKAGYRLYLDTQCVISHMGQAPYPLTEDLLPKNPTGIPAAAADLDQW